MRLQSMLKIHTRFLHRYFILFILWNSLLVSKKNLFEICKMYTVLLFSIPWLFVMMKSWLTDWLTDTRIKRQVKRKYMWERRKRWGFTPRQFAPVIHRTWKRIIRYGPSPKSITKSLAPGIEPGSRTWQARILTTILREMCFYATDLCPHPPSSDDVWHPILAYGQLLVAYLPYTTHAYSSLHLKFEIPY